ncbi:MAG: hypothetical protein MZV70_01295 [Desulfobacterales bacterium]|nr:hypothetical protein [Desulfobacterales bacterium]
MSAVWTQDQKIRTTLTLQANIDPSDVKVMEEALQAAKGALGRPQVHALRRGQHHRHEGLGGLADRGHPHPHLRFPRDRTRPSASP